MMKRNKIIVAIATVVVAALVLRYVPRTRSVAQAGSPLDLVELAPANSTLIAYADLAALRNSPLVQRLAAMAPPANTGRDYADFVSATGFDYQRDLDRVVLASRPGTSSDETLVLAEGRFNHQKIEQYALRSGKLEQQGSRSVYVVPSSTPGKNVSMVFLADDRIVLSDGGDLSPVLAPPSPASFDPAMRQRLLRVAGAPLFAVARVPATTSAGSTSGAPAAVLESLRWASFAARPDADSVLLSAEGECDTPEQAQQVAGTADFVRNLLRGGLANPKAQGQMSADTVAAARHILEATSITTDAMRVRLLVTVTADMLAATTPHATPPTPNSSTPSRH